MSKKGIFGEAAILVVDDNNINLFVMNKMLEEYGLTPDCVPGGKQCIKKVEKKKYDLIFMDHFMPQLDGIETFRVLKEHSDFHTPVIILTGNTGTELDTMYQKEGFAEFIPKPVDSDTLERILMNYLPHVSKTELEDEEDTVEPEMDKEQKNADLLYHLGFTIIKDLIADHMSIAEYEELLGIFREESEEKMPDAEKYQSQQNMKEYAVIVHGLKNDAGMIGDDALSTLAKEHEIESKAGNLEFMISEWPHLKEEWNETLERIEKYLTQKY